ncbi:MAG TPA: hypothetical protein VFW53_00940 [Gallionella sp.]|nr:hypothetical protein [Gallionella sp.]
MTWLSFFDSLVGWFAKLPIAGNRSRFPGYLKRGGNQNREASASLVFRPQVTDFVTLRARLNS